MKQEYKKYDLIGNGANIIVNMQSFLRAAGDAVAKSVADVLDRLTVAIECGNVSGAVPVPYTFDNGSLSISLTNLPVGTNRLIIEAQYGTNTIAQQLIDLVVLQGATGIDELGTLNFGAVDNYGDGGAATIVREGNATIMPGAINDFGTVAGALTITKGSGDGEYMIVLTAGANTSVTFSGWELVWNGGVVPTFIEGKVYEISIIGNRATFGEF